jgi:hypothetical protein
VFRQIGPPAFRYLLAAVVVADILTLAALRIDDTVDPQAIVNLALFFQLRLLVGFAALTVIDFRAAVAVVVLELALGGASGGWTMFPGMITGRLMLDATVLLRAVIGLALSARAGQLRLWQLGRYTIHAVALAVVIPAAWMSIGLVNGNRPVDVFGDGNGHFFFAFAALVAALAYIGDLGWLRKWLLVACAAIALMTFGLAVVAVTGVATVIPTLHDALLGRLDMGGVVGILNDGKLRLYLGSGLYLQVGVALVTWELLRQPRRTWPWLLAAVLVVDLIFTWTRGYWLGAMLAFGVVLLFGSGGLRRPLQLLGVTVAVLLVMTVGALATGSTLPYDIFDRAIGIVGLGADEMGSGSNFVRAVQAEVLSAHIAERPFLGWGFGTIAPDYPYGDIYSYELAYLDLAYKTGIVGVLLFLSFPLRLLLDSVRARLGRIQLPPGVTAREAAVPGAIILSLLVTGATNPYLTAAFGLAPIILSIAWLDPFGSDDGARGSLRSSNHDLPG